MKKIKNQIIFLILSIISLLGTILSFVFLQQYIPEYFIYINDNWNSGYTSIIQRGPTKCKIPLLKDKTIKVYKKSQNNFFNQNEINYNLEKSNNIISYHFNKTFYNNLVQCLDNRTNYFDTTTYKYEDNITNLTKCKFIDSLNNISCDNYTQNKMIDYVNNIKYTEVVFGQNQPCFDPRYYNFNMTFNKTSYYYDKSKCPGGKVNKYYHFIYEVPLSEIIKHNELKELNETLNEETKNEIIYVYGRNYIGIKGHCNKNSFKELNNIIGGVNENIKSSIIWLGYTIIIEIIFFLLFLNKFIVKYHNYINNDETKELLPPYTKPVILILSLIMLGFHALIFTYLLNITKFIELFNDSTCFEDETGQLIKPSIIFLIIGRYTQIGILLINGFLAFKYGIKKGIKYAN